jgi:hypothetical protein
LAGIGLARLAGVERVRRPFGGRARDDADARRGRFRAAPAPIAEQRAFCERFLLPWAFGCCNAISECPIANYYVEVAQFSASFLALERDSFAIE